ncbi:MAG TPA: DUF4249 domain-containing protein [Flavobacterium sp.]|jgi:hypothetical protein
MKKNVLYIVLLLFLSYGCTDPYKLQTETFDDILVVEATITNEMKRQEIKLSKTYRLEESSPLPVAGASVVVTDDAGNSYEFSEIGGIYLSDIPFQAVPGRAYNLEISTTDGRSYSSIPTTLTTASPITNVTAAVETLNGVEGVQIRVNSFDPTGTSKYYRFRYDETYKVIAPKWTGVYAVIDNHPPSGYGPNDDIILLPRTEEAQTCFKTNPSDQILLSSTLGLTEDRIENFPVRFIDKHDDIIANRYSINVFQYVQSAASYEFYETLREMSGAGGDILSPNQPGYFSGNIKSTTNPSEKVMGFFEVSSVSEYRIFFNYDEMFPGILPPPFFMDCEPITLDSTDFSLPDNEGGTLFSNLAGGFYLYYEHFGIFYDIVRKECGDCTTFASNVVPPFWVD